MNILVTGGAGFIGSHLVEYWRSRASVSVIDNLRTGTLENLAGFNDVTLVEGSILDEALLRRAMEDVDYVFHLAAMVSVPESMSEPESCVDINSKGTLKVLRAAAEAGVKKVCFSSSSAIYGDDPVLPKREDMLPCPKSPYAIAKLSGEYYCQFATEHYGLPTASLRYFNVFGPRQDPNSPYAAAIPAFISRARKAEDLVVFGDGTQTRDFVYVKDVVAANVFCAEHLEVTGVYNVGYGRATVISDLAQSIVALTGNKSRVVYSEPRPGDVKHSVAATDKLAEAGFRCEGELESALETTILSFSEAGEVE